MHSFSLFSALLLIPILAGNDRIEVHDIQAAFGPIWPERRSNIYYPQDQIFFRFAVEGAKYNSKKQFDVDIITQLKDGRGRIVLMKNQPFNGEPFLGGNTFWGQAHLPITDPLPEGDYTAIVTINDNLTRQSTSFEKPIMIRPKELGMQSVMFFADPEKKWATGSNYQVGQSLFVKASANGVSIKENQVDVGMKLEIIDFATGNELSKGRWQFDIKQHVSSENTPISPSVTFQFASGGLSRPGQYRLRLLVNDRLAEKEIAYETRISVSAP